MLRVGLAGAVALGAGCSFDATQTVIDGAHGPSDARVDAAPGDPCLDWTFAPAELDPCEIPQPTSTALVDLPGGTWTIDGATGVLDDGAGTIFTLDHVADLRGVSVVSVDHLRIATGATLRAIGPRPLAIVAWTDADVLGTLDASSVRDNSISPIPTWFGAGANAPTCPGGEDAPQQGTNGTGGDGGSGGGGFGGAGGAGGGGGGGDGDRGAGGRGRALPTRIEGGCAGAAAPAGAAGIGGAGGGAVAVIVKHRLTIGGQILAGGEGGGGALSGGSEAGGGGGSGGMIKVEADDLLFLSGLLAANGGQGGGGNHNNSASPGVDGRADTTNAPISNKEGGGTSGGGGGHLDQIDGLPASDANDGGGGGGGGAGFIVYKGHTAQTVTGQMSPDGIQL